jgi:hypothetical protein
VTVRLRSGSELNDDAVVLIHMGAGDPANIARGAVTNYSAYVGVRSASSGLFAISVFAAADDVAESDITSAFGHKQFGRATYGAVRRAGFEVLPTTIELLGMTPAVMALQRVHYDIVLDVDYDLSELPDDEAALAALEGAVAGVAASVMDLFLPRERKPSG